MTVGYTEETLPRGQLWINERIPAAGFYTPVKTCGSLEHDRFASTVASESRARTRTRGGGFLHSRYDKMFINPLDSYASILLAIRHCRSGGLVAFREHDWLILGTDQRAELGRLAWFYGVTLVSAEELGAVA